MLSRFDRLVLVLSTTGFLLSQMAIRRLGRPGAVMAAGVTAGLAVRDAALVASGTPGRMERGPAILLWLELAAAIVATVLGLRLAIDKDPAGRAAARRPGRAESARRSAMGMLFGLSTSRVRVHLDPDHGLKSPD